MPGRGGAAHDGEKSMKTDRPKIINKYQLFIGLVVLALGTLVYLVDRPPDQTYFVSESRVDISLHEKVPGLFGRIGRSLPTFTHVFAFILITAGLMNCRKRGCLIITVFWFAVDSLFEIGQKFSDTAVNLVPSWFSEIPFLENTDNYFKTGTFDWIDMATILLGALLAYMVLMRTMDAGAPDRPGSL